MLEPEKLYRKKRFFECHRNTIPIYFIIFGIMEIIFSYNLKEYDARIAFFNAGSCLCYIGAMLGLILNVILPFPLIEVNKNEKSDN